MIFQQTTPPPGWTKQITNNDKALRVVTGAVGTGGVHPFTTVFSKTDTNSVVLSTNEMPNHTHGVNDPTHGHGVNDPSHTHGSVYNNDGGSVNVGVAPNTGNGGGAWISSAFTGIGINPGGTGISINANGGGGGHTHDMDMQVLYVDVIIATKD
jgi:hypothetical protein